MPLESADSTPKQGDCSFTSVHAGYDPQQHDDDTYYGDGSEADLDDDHMSVRMSAHLSVQNSESDAGAELSGDNKKKASSDADDDEEDVMSELDVKRNLSLPGTPARDSPGWHPGSVRPVWLKDYASETEAWQPQTNRWGGDGDRSFSYYERSFTKAARERRLESSWEMRRGHYTGDGADSHSGGSSPCVVVRPRGNGAACMCMDLEEVRGCRDLGLELPSDWTVEIPTGAFHGAAPADTSSGRNSPVGNSSRTSSPGDNPRDVKAKLRVWAKAVAQLASPSRFSS